MTDSNPTMLREEIERELEVSRELYEWIGRAEELRRCYAQLSTEVRAWHWPVKYVQRLAIKAQLLADMAERLDKAERERHNND